MQLVVILALLLYTPAISSESCADADCNDPAAESALNLLQSGYVMKGAVVEAHAAKGAHSLTADCKSWCANKIAQGNTWDTICNWDGCSLCTECGTTTTTTTTTTAIPEWQSPYFLMGCSGTQVLTTEWMTEEDYDAAFQAVQKLYDSLPVTCNATYCPQADFAGCVLRIAGHDFMDYADGTGGADGCLDMEDGDNAGLAECIHSGEHGYSVADAYANFCSSISLADFFVISAEAVITSSRQHVINDDSTRSAIDFKSNFKWGRTTQTNCSFAHGRLPNPENSCSAVETTFVDRMGLSWKQAAALMGVHSLGRAQIGNSGYNGWWSDFENSRRFNNDYYASIVAKGWGPEVNVNGNAGKNQWKRIDVGVDEATLGKEMMLDTDMCLYFTADDAGEVELKAATAEADSCTCTWGSAVHVQEATSKYMDGKFCGTDDIPGSSDFPRQRALCCGLGDNYSINDQWMDCGLPLEPMGPAASYIKKFANDEDTWLTAFMNAWRIATTNGFESLKVLK